MPAARAPTNGWSWSLQSRTQSLVRVRVRVRLGLGVRVTAGIRVGIRPRVGFRACSVIVVLEHQPVHPLYGEYDHFWHAAFASPQLGKCRVQPTAEA